MSKELWSMKNILQTKALAFLICMLLSATAFPEKVEKPNFILVFVDDMGYGDLGCFGHPTIQTPALDKMAAEGQRWTNFYSAASVCTPSRTGLLTGRLAIRSGMCADWPPVLSAVARGGLPDSEITLAEILKSQGYTTGCLGKWHLGHRPQYLPTNRGFDYFFGTPFSNDEAISPEWRPAFKGFRSWEAPLFYEPKSEYWDIPLMRGTDIIERPVDQTTLTQNYTREAIQFIQSHRDKPFFLYLAHNMPHVPLFASPGFRGKSRRGLYGDVVEEIDWSVAQIRKTLEDEGLSERTLLVFTSDNGPWMVFHEHGGSAGLLRDEKGTTWEGGMRVPAIFYWPSVIRPGMIPDLGTNMDLFTTFCLLAGAQVPQDRVIDGIDLSPVLLGEGPGLREFVFYYRGTQLYAVRKGAFKAHFTTKSAWGKNLKATTHEPPLLYNLNIDPSERWDIAEEHPEMIAEIRAEFQRHKSQVVPVENQILR